MVEQHHRLLEKTTTFYLRAEIASGKESKPERCLYNLIALHHQLAAMQEFWMTGASLVERLDMAFGSL
jgi:hypothetical protein